jgi:RHS repeat-associated protein
LVEVSQTAQGGAANTTTYRYDPFGRRISKTNSQGGATSTTYYVYNDTGLMAELNEQGQMTKAYGFNPQAAQAGLWSTDPLWQAEVSNSNLKDPATSYHYLHTDHLGTPILATDKTGQTTWKGISEAFGQTRVDNASSITMNLRFPGQYWDSETQTHYNFHRDYRPNTGRYLQSDPIGIKGGVNSYTYVEATPSRGIDPNGLVTWSGTVISVGAVRGFGVAAAFYDLQSECLCGKKVRIKGRALFAAAGFGMTYTINSGGSTFYDNYPCPQENAANGPAAGASIAVVTVGGAAISVTGLGSLRTTWPPLSTGLVGFDVSAVVMIGWSSGTGTTEDCCE